MKVAICGPTGFVGQELGLGLVRAGHQVVAIVRNAAEAKKNLPFPAQIFEWHLNSHDSKNQLREAFVGVDAIINLVGENISKRWTKAHVQAMRDSRIQSTQAIVDVLKSNTNQSPKIFINASAVGYYQPHTDNQAIDESGPRGSGILPDLCRDWEAEAAKAPPTIRTVIVRLGIVLGRCGGMMPQILPLFRKGMGSQLGNGEQWMPWIHVQDTVAFFLWLLKSSGQGIYNATSPQPMRNKDFTKELARILKQRVLPLPAPEIALRATLGKQSALLLKGQKVIPRRAQAEGFEFRFSPLSEALIDICGDDIENGISEFTCRQWIQRPLDEVFKFFQNENNLEILTPPLLHFHVLNKSTPTLQSGTKINYKLKIHGVPMRWQSLIKDWRPPLGFVDLQTKGPYKLWRHTHSFEALGDGTLITDRVQYKLPLGILGALAAGSFVRKDVKQIFDFRRDAVYYGLDKKVQTIPLDH